MLNFIIKNKKFIIKLRLLGTYGQLINDNIKKLKIFHFMIKKKSLNSVIYI